MPLPFLIAGGVGYLIKAILDEEEIRIKDEQLAKNSLEAEKLKEVVSSHLEHTRYILSLSALGIAMANADGIVTKEEVIELREYICGIAGEKLPKHILEEVMKLWKTPPSFNEVVEIWSEYAIDYREIVKAEHMLISIMEADGEAHENERVFLEAFKIKMEEIYVKRLENGK